MGRTKKSSFQHIYVDQLIFFRPNELQYYMYLDKKRSVPYLIIIEINVRMLIKTSTENMPSHKTDNINFQTFGQNKRVINFS